MRRAARLDCSLKNGVGSAYGDRGARVTCKFRRRVGEGASSGGNGCVGRPTERRALNEGANVIRDGRRTDGRVIDAGVCSAVGRLRYADSLLSRRWAHVGARGNQKSAPMDGTCRLAGSLKRRVLSVKLGRASLERRTCGSLFGESRCLFVPRWTTRRSLVSTLGGWNPNRPRAADRGSASRSA